MPRGLVLEGGAMRGLFSAGVIDVLMEHSLRPDGIVGVSAGACFGCNYKSWQPGRAIRYNMRYARDPRYSGLWSLLTSGNMFNARFAYHTVPTLHDPFDSNRFESDKMEFYVVCTDVDTGQPVYHRCDCGGHPFFEWVRASASMPLVSRIVRIDGMRLLDGGVADSVPLEFFERHGYTDNIVVLTQPAGYVKHPSRALPLIRLFLRKHPEFVKAMERRHLMYNAQIDYVTRAEAEGRCLVIRPDAPLPIGHMSHSPHEMEHVYRLGREAALRHIDRITALWNKQ